MHAISTSGDNHVTHGLGSQRGYTIIVEARMKKSAGAGAGRPGFYDYDSMTVTIP